MQIPAGNYVELSVDLINEGQFCREMSWALQRGFAELLRLERVHGATGGSKFTVSAKIKVSRMDEAIFGLETEVHVAPPKVKQLSIARGGEERLICQPEGSSRDDPDQIRLFDAQGRAKGVIDSETGELIEPAADVSLSFESRRPAKG